MTSCHEQLHLPHRLRSVRLSVEADRSEADFEQRLRDRYEQGLRDGEKALREQVLQQRSDVLELQQGVLQSLRQALSQVRSACETGLVDLAMVVAQKLVAGIPISPESVECAIREALTQAEDTHEILVLLNQEDFDLLQRVNSPVLLATAAGEKVRFEKSTEVTRGGCLIQTRFGVVDARRETKFELLKKSLQT